MVLHKHVQQPYSKNDIQPIFIMYIPPLYVICLFSRQPQILNKLKMIKELSRDLVTLIHKDYPELEELNLSNNGKSR